MSALITAAPGTPHGPKLCLSVFQITGHLSEEPGEHLRLHAARPLFVDAFVKRAKNTRQGLNAPSHAFFFFRSMELYIPLSQPGGAYQHLAPLPNAAFLYFPLIYLLN